MLSEEGRSSTEDARGEQGSAEPAATLISSSRIGELTRLQAEIAALKHENSLLQEKLNAALDGTGICLWQGIIPTGELRVFNLQNFQAGDMAPCFDQWSAKLHPDDRAHAMGSYFDHLEGKTPFYEVEYRTINPQGEVTWLWDRGRVVDRDIDGKPLRIMGSHIDITQRKAYEQRLAERANSDALTGLLNRQGFGKAFAQQQHDGAGALLFIDLDDFKGINDQLG
ncbi:MAG: PAS domain-containing protein, partial [Aeromonas jandaei]